MTMQATACPRLPVLLGRSAPSGRRNPGTPVVPGSAGAGDRGAAGRLRQEREKAASTAPVEITRSTSCELDGMLLMDYPGPKGQIHYAGMDQPLFYCDTMEVLNTLLVPEQVRKVNAVYVQDMGKTDWDNPQGAWIDARTAIFVHGSKRKGSMGPTLPASARRPTRRSSSRNTVANWCA